jgi:hypothetical protein
MESGQRLQVWKKGRGSCGGVKKRMGLREIEFKKKTKTRLEIKGAEEKENQGDNVK